MCSVCVAGVGVAESQCCTDVSPMSHRAVPQMSTGMLLAGGSWHLPLFWSSDPTYLQVTIPVAKKKQNSVFSESYEADMFNQISISVRIQYTWAQMQTDRTNDRVGSFGLGWKMTGQVDRHE